MRSCSLLCLVLALCCFLGCAKAYVNPNIENSKQSDVQFERDSVHCDAVSGEKFPLDKRRQLDEYRLCMESKGWQERGQMEVYLPDRKKK